ncbi:hypothetical protein CHELA1G11_20425 [Hyphomicrobiales bacterium]|nr:hypothetical protein CHELA1G11_20425 [Hyphomicrobiales bacterium]CAH1690150.1 hypothetical protein CHELA1G2_20738 [Hyphomicrobiales bacterium]
MRGGGSGILGQDKQAASMEEGVLDWHFDYSCNPHLGGVNYLPGRCPACGRKDKYNGNALRCEEFHEHSPG